MSDQRGILYPERLPTFRRIPAPESVAGWVRWFWIPEWDLAPGQVSRQHLIAYAASNLVVEPAEVGLAGPTTRASTRDLVGTGWAVGALLRPAAVPGFTSDPASLRDSYAPVACGDLHHAVSAAMTSGEEAEQRHERAVAAFTDWLVERLPRPSIEGESANAMVDLLENDSRVRTLDDASAALHHSARTLQRLAATYVGLSPTTIIRRRRLQEAAERVRTDPGTDLAALAAELGYADHAHLSGDFRSVLGIAPRDYRTATVGEPSGALRERGKDGDQ